MADGKIKSKLVFPAMPYRRGPHIPDMKVPGKSLNSPMEKAVRHRRVQQPGHNPSVSGILVPLEIRFRPESRSDGAVFVRPKIQAQGSRTPFSAKRTLGMTVLFADRHDRALMIAEVPADLELPGDEIGNRLFRRIRERPDHHFDSPLRKQALGATAYAPPAGHSKPRSFNRDLMYSRLLSLRSESGGRRGPPGRPRRDRAALTAIGLVSRRRAAKRS